MSSYLCLSAALGKQLEMTAIIPEMESATDTRSQSSVYDTSLSIAMRKKLNIYGLTPPQPETYKIQKARCFAQLSQKKTNIEKYQYLLALKHSNVHLFYRIVTDHFCELAPLVYTPVVGEACQRWSEIYQNPEGLYISYRDKGRIAEVVNNWPQENVEISVITDGSRILGLGDLGIGGMGIAVGKLILYTACVGIRPERVLPLTVDTGTNNSALRSDPLYLGHRSEKISSEEKQELLDEVMETLVRRWPNILIQFEDWKNPFPSLARYAPKYTMFNDDVQGTGAVIMGGIISAVKESGVAPKDHRAVFFGARSAGVGVAQQIVEYFKQQGLSEKEAKEIFWFVDTKGLITMDRGDEKLAEHKIYFARNDNDGQQFKTLEEVIDFVKPTILMGLSTIGGAFGKSILQKMAQWNDRPIIFPLSNPISKSECTYEEAIVITDGRVLFASGSPFDPVAYRNRTYYPSQGNNMYVFPGIGLGSIICKASRVTAIMIFAAGEAVPSKLSDAEKKDGLMYPRLTRIREVSSRVALRVIRAAQEENMDDEPHLRTMPDTQLESLIQARMYKPHSFLEEVSGMT